MGGVPHQMVIAYLRGSMGTDDKNKIQKWQKEDPTGQLFFELIDGVKTRTRVLPSADPSHDIPASHASAENLLLRILSEDAQPEEEQRFMDAMLFSPLFYKRTLAMLATSGKDSLDEIPELTQIKVASDQKILSKIIGDAKDDESATMIPNTRSGPKTSSVKPHGLLEFLGRLPRLAFAVPVIAAAIAIVMIIRFPSAQRLSYVYDQVVPYDPDSSSLRSATEAAASLGSRLSRFEQGMSEYLARNYTAAVRIFASLETSLRSAKESISSQSGDWQFYANFHLYSGLSYFALSRTERDLDENLRTEHAQKAITHLTQAYDWAKGQEFADRDALIYFLGLAHGLSGNEEVAVRYLNEVKAASEFYIDAVNRIADWSG
ncbi:hypothetical protein MJD09_22865 [bacterium]|nr:hypothetical protein [bacterium]